MTRVSNTSMTMTMVANLNRNLYEVVKVQRQLATGKVVNKPSDDPIGLNRVLSLKTALGETRQFIRNAQDAFSWAQSTELVLADVTNSMQRVREVVMKAGSGTLENSSRQALARELEQIADHVFSLANSSFDGERYLFGGFKTTAPPFVRLGDGTVVYNGDDGAHHFEIARGISIEANIPGDQAFMQPDLFAIIADARDGVLSGDVDAISQSLEAIDQAIEASISQRSVAGARMNRMDMAIERYKDEELNLASLLSQTEDVDMAEALLVYALRENTYQAALSVAARALQPTLLDFL